MITTIFSFFLVFRNAFPYVFQYLKIRRHRSAAGFSLLVCLVVCVANILRINFWFGKRFETCLLLQSIGMIIYMIPMLEISARMNRLVTPLSKQKSIWKGDILNAFWKWDDLSSYIITLLAFSLASGTVTYFFWDSPVYVEGIGTLSLMIEAFLGMPQVILNFRRKSTKGLSIKMVLMLTLAESIKTSYFIYLQTPPQFLVCSSLQIMINVIILLQVYFYRNEYTLIPTHIELRMSKLMSK